MGTGSGGALFEDRFRLTKQMTAVMMMRRTIPKRIGNTMARVRRVESNRRYKTKYYVLTIKRDFL